MARIRLVLAGAADAGHAAAPPPPAFVAIVPKEATAWVQPPPSARRAAARSRHASEGRRVGRFRPFRRSAAMRAALPTTRRDPRTRLADVKEAPNARTAAGAAQTLAAGAILRRAPVAAAAGAGAALGRAPLRGALGVRCPSTTPPLQRRERLRCAPVGAFISSFSPPRGQRCARVPARQKTAVLLDARARSPRARRGPPPPPPSRRGAPSRDLRLHRPPLAHLSRVPSAPRARPPRTPPQRAASTRRYGRRPVRTRADAVDARRPGATRSPPAASSATPPWRPTPRARRTLSEWTRDLRSSSRSREELMRVLLGQTLHPPEEDAAVAAEMVSERQRRLPAFRPRAILLVTLPLIAGMAIKLVADATISWSEPGQNVSPILSNFVVPYFAWSLHRQSLGRRFLLARRSAGTTTTGQIRDGPARRDCRDVGRSPLYARDLCAPHLLDRHQDEPSADNLQLGPKRLTGRRVGRRIGLSLAWVRWALGCWNHALPIILVGAWASRREGSSPPRVVIATSKAARGGACRTLNRGRSDLCPFSVSRLGDAAFGTHALAARAVCM